QLQNNQPNHPVNIRSDYRKDEGELRKKRGREVIVENQEEDKENMEKNFGKQTKKVRQSEN
ncbi:1254_t:CDS:1, partial [Gigaspora rosea]